MLYINSIKSFLLTSSVFTLAYCGQAPGEMKKWKSLSRNLSFVYADPWSLLPTLDTKEKTLTGVINTEDGKSYVIQITGDVMKQEMSDETYFAGTKQTMLQANERNKLIAENDTTFHGVSAHKQVYLMYTKKWGIMKQVSFVIRTGVEAVSIQILFPATEEDALTKAIPQQLVEFDRTVRMIPK